MDESNMSPFLKVVTNKYFATILTLVLSYLLAKVGYAEIWPLFGSANQLLSCLLYTSRVEADYKALTAVIRELAAES